MEDNNRLNVLRELVLLTSYFSEDRVDLLQQLWTSLSKVPENVKIITNFMIDTIVDRVSYQNIIKNKIKINKNKKKIAK